MAAGRPSSYRPEYAKMLLDYFQRPAWDTPEKQADGSVVVKAGFFPTLAGFCCEIGTTQQTLNAWANAKEIDDSPMWPEFLDAYRRAKEYQEKYFTEGYMRGAYTSPTIGALIAKNILSWKDKTEQEVTSQVTAVVQTTSKVEIDFSDIVADAKKIDG